ncbi:MAG TPA: LLM class flavin-dependent oxidoreductase, partial [Mycobacterium sp.]|nr:LLM class flavin-dependent oxidoreductase [Mycobacterium sp.]
MKIGAMIEPRLPGAVEFAVAAERIGVSSLWIPEVWGYDALTGLAYLAAKTSSIDLGTFVVQLGSRSPALLATSALSLEELSGGRFILGIGTSGPRVMEGWHGVRFRKPVQTTRE